MDALAALANAKMPGLRVAPPDDRGDFTFSHPTRGWLEELNSIRAYALSTGDWRLPVLSAYKSLVSGPWPINWKPTNIIGGVDSNGESVSVGARNVEFYYGDDGGSVVLAMECRGYFITFHIGNPSATSSNTFRYFLGGGITARFKARVTVRCFPSVSSPTCIATGSSAFSGSWTYDNSTQPLFYKDVDADLAPGWHDISLSMSGAVFNNIYNPGPNLLCYALSGFTGRASLTAEASSSVSVHGIHRSLPVRKITSESSGEGFGLFGTNYVLKPQYLVGGPGGVPPDPPDLDPSHSYEVLASPGVIYTASVPGFFKGKRPPISFLNQMSQEWYPWNHLKTPPPGSIHIGIPDPDFTPNEFEDMPAPFVWTPSTPVNKNSVVVEGDKNFVSLHSGTTGSSPPSWANTVVYDGGVTWKQRPFIEAQAKMFSSPRYPFKHHVESDPQLDPQTRHAYWNLFDPIGAWIYRVTLHRAPTLSADGIYVKNPADFLVELGCIRNSSFVSFGSFLTGTSFDAMWPVFTQDPIVCVSPNDERIEVHAECIFSPPLLAAGLPSASESLSFPICAAHYNDTEAVLNQM